MSKFENDEFGGFSEIDRMNFYTGLMFDALKFIKKLGLLEEFKNIVRKKAPSDFLETFIDLCAEEEQE